LPGSSSLRRQMMLQALTETDTNKELDNSVNTDTNKDFYNSVDAWLDKDLDKDFDTYKQVDPGSKSSI